MPDAPHPPEVLGREAGPDRSLEGARPQAAHHAGAAPAAAARRATIAASCGAGGAASSWSASWCVATTGGVAAVVFNIELPPEESLLQTSFVCAADVTEACGPDNAIATFSAEEDRTNVQLDEVPAVLQQAVLATEDQDYYEHGGIDPVGIGRALYQRHPRHGRHPGRLHDHPAVRQERLPHLRAQHRPQGEGGGARGEARARARARTRSSSATSTPSTSGAAPTA